MDRRHLLATCVGSGLLSLAGCIGSLEDFTEQGDDSESDNDGEDTSNESMTLSLSHDEDLESLSFDVELIEGELTSDEVPVFDVAITNTGEEDVTWRQSQSDYALPQTGSKPSGLTIGLEDEITAHLMEDVRGCARTEFGIVRDDVLVTTILEPGEVIEQRYAIAGRDRDLDGHCPQGSYRAEWNYGEAGKWAIEFELAEN